MKGDLKAVTHHGQRCWVGGSVFVVKYTFDHRPPQFYAYRAVGRVPKGRAPWSVNNKRVGKYRTLAEAESAIKEPCE